MGDKHLFVDLEAMNRRDEGRFDLPPLARRQSVEAGEFARLATAVSAHHWVWVEVTERTPFGYRGIVDVAPGFGSSCPVASGDVVDFIARNVLEIYTRQAVGQDPGYEELLADAEKLDGAKYWDPVLRIENEEIANLLPINMHGADGKARLADYLARHPLCSSCEARGIKIKIEATTAVQADPGDGDESLMPLCRICAYVIVARVQGWPVRGCDADGMPNDPQHPWNKDNR